MLPLLRSGSNYGLLRVCRADVVALVALSACNSLHSWLLEVTDSYHVLGLHLWVLVGKVGGLEPSVSGSS